MLGPGVPQSARRWNGLLFAKSSPLLHALVADNHQRSRPAGRCSLSPHSDWTDGRNTCGTWGHTADSSLCGHSFQERLDSLSACKSRVVSCRQWRRTREPSCPVFFFRVTDSFSNDRLFLSTDIFKWRSHDFGECDRSCRCFYLHFFFALSS